MILRKFPFSMFHVGEWSIDCGRDLQLPTSEEEMSIDFIFPIIFMQVMLFSLVSNEYSAWC
jgi:hypothetical protein